jgi:hypothetical protein
MTNESGSDEEETIQDEQVFRHPKQFFHHPEQIFRRPSSLISHASSCAEPDSFNGAKAVERGPALRLPVRAGGAWADDNA